VLEFLAGAPLEELTEEGLKKLRPECLSVPENGNSVLKFKYSSVSLGLGSLSVRIVQKEFTNLGVLSPTVREGGVGPRSRSGF